MIITRQAEVTVKDLASKYPVVAVSGPRQTGKTTLCLKCFPDKPYVNIEEPHIKRLATDDPKGFVSQYANGAILDEIQNAPQLLSYLQVIVDKIERDDRQKSKGLFILTGSEQLSLNRHINQTLAGRIALVTLLPFTASEIVACLPDYLAANNIDQVMIRGFFPRLFADNTNHTEVYSNYYRTYIERDVRNTANPQNISDFDKFVRMCATRIGSLVNVSSISSDLGVSNNTIKGWLLALQQSHVVLLLEPFYENINKRLVRSPKLYFVDPGLVCYLLGIETVEQLVRDPLRGALFENYVLLELVKYRLNQGKDHNLFFYRDRSGNEVDFIYKSAAQYLPIEVKMNMTPKPEQTKGLDYFNRIMKGRSQGGFVVYSGTEAHILNDKRFVGYPDIQQAFS